MTDHDVLAASRGRTLTQAGLGCASVLLLHVAVVAALFGLGWLVGLLGDAGRAGAVYGVASMATLLVGATQLLYVVPLAAVAVWFQQRAFAAGVGIAAGLTLLLNGCVVGLLGGAIALCVGIVANNLNF